MELLAPAGDMTQALKSIEAGCDALYGGLKCWNARHRAGNFSLEEYNEILEICHKRGIRFYLTLNTLFRDEELETIRELFRSENFRYPDAVLVADIGLMKMLYSEFPDVVLHASTQFGAYAIDDIKFLSQYNVRRVVLARELILSEIGELRRNTDVELEIFVYGSQCICFSGQCLWGGLINACSGNRGRCTGMCRDVYRKDGLAGQFMYPQDINAVDIVETLVDMGINSIKIEGRIRNSDETTEAVKSFRRAIDSLSSNGKKHYMGYLSNSVPVKNMLAPLNPRTIFPSEFSVNYGEHDILYCDKPIPGIYSGNTVNNQKSRYLMSAFTNKFVPGDLTVSINMVFHNRLLQKIILIDPFGERVVFIVSCQKPEPTRLADLYQFFSKSLNVGMYEFLSNIPENEILNVDWDIVTDTIKKIDKFCDSKSSDFKKIKDDLVMQPNIKDSIIQTDNADDIRLFKKAGVKKYIFEIKSKETLINAIGEENEEVVAIYKLPLLDFNHGLENILPLLKGKKVLISRLSQLLLNDIYGFSSIYADYTVNIWNTYAAKVLKEHGVISFTAHPELSTEYTAFLSEKAGLPFSMITWGKIALGFTRACFDELRFCNKNCGDNLIVLEDTVKGYNIEVRCDNVFGYRIINRTSVHVCCSSKKAVEYRCILSGLGQNQKENIISGNFTEEPNINYIYRGNVR